MSCRLRLEFPVMHEVSTPSADGEKAKLKQLLQFLDVDPDNCKLICEVAELSIRLGLLDQAKGLLLKGECVHPENCSIKYCFGVLYVAQGDFDAAEQCFSSLLNVSGLSNFARYNLAHVKLLKLDLDAAEHLLANHISVIQQDVPNVKSLSSRILHHQGKLAQATEMIESYLRANADDSEALGLAGLLALDLENYAAATGYAEKSLQINPGNVEAMVVKATVALADANLEAAEAIYTRALELNRDSGRAWVGLGLACMAQQKMEDAESNMIQGMRLMSSHVGSWIALAWCQIGMYKLLEARDSLGRAVDINRNFDEAHGGLAVVDVLEGKLDSARESIKKALGLNPRSFSAHFANSLIASSSGDIDRAEKIVRRLMNAPINQDGNKLIDKLSKMQGENK